VVSDARERRGEDSDLECRRDGDESRVPVTRLSGMWRVASGDSEWRVPASLSGEWFKFGDFTPASGEWFGDRGRVASRESRRVAASGRESRVLVSGEWRVTVASGDSEWRVVVTVVERASRESRCW
jgi:hypothetical protein